jgi:aspartate/methionine/tyrosine aminotransferase
MLSNRLPASLEPNAIARALDELRSGGVRVVDLTDANPTHVGLDYPPELLAPLAHPRGLSYDPQPFGLRAAREAVAADARTRGAAVDAERVVLTASTSEAYSWLFKVLCDPGACVLVPRPSYPLFEHLTRLEGLRTAAYDLEYHRRWEIDFATVAAAPRETKALIVVSPNNPTGSYVSPSEIGRLSEICRDRGWALIADEVFAEYALDEETPTTDLAATDAEVLTFTLGGASKSLGLPQLKLAWLIAGGPEAERQAALAALEIIADTFLSVGTPIQASTSDLMTAARSVRDAIRQRVRGNLRCLRQLSGGFPASEVLRVEGGWSAVIRVPSRSSEEQLVLELLRQHHVLVHPGYFFDFPRESYLVVSLLVAPDVFAEAIIRVLRFVS